MIRGCGVCVCAAACDCITLRALATMCNYVHHAINRISAMFGLKSNLGEYLVLQTVRVG